MAVRFAGSFERHELGGRPLLSVEVALLQEAAYQGSVDSPDELLMLLVAIGGRYEECEPNLQALQREAIVPLQRRGGEWSLPKGLVLRTGCEACGRVFTISRRTSGLLREIRCTDALLLDNWDDPPRERLIHSADDPPRLRFLLNGLEKQAGLPPTGYARYDSPLRLGGPPGSTAPIPDGVVRYVIVCRWCQRRRLARCEHETLQNGDWRRCTAVAVGSVYCTEHQRNAYRRARGHGYRHRRSPLS
jgi:hypothetical protein